MPLFIYLKGYGIHYKKAPVFDNAHPEFLMLTSAIK